MINVHTLLPFASENDVAITTHPIPSVHRAYVIKMQKGNYQTKNYLCFDDFEATDEENDRTLRWILEETLYKLNKLIKGGY